jgi:hypothetical protein
MTAMIHDRAVSSREAGRVYADHTRNFPVLPSLRFMQDAVDKLRPSVALLMLLIEPQKVRAGLALGAGIDPAIVNGGKQNGVSFIS